MYCSRLDGSIFISSPVASVGPYGLSKILRFPSADSGSVAARRRSQAANFKSAARISPAPDAPPSPSATRPRRSSSARIPTDRARAGRRRRRRTGGRPERRHQHSAPAASRRADRRRPASHRPIRPSTATAISTPPSADRAGRRRRCRFYKWKPRPAKPMPFVSDLMNATGLAIDAGRRALRVQPPRRQHLSGVVAPATASIYVEGMGVATGIVFDRGRQSVRRRPQRHHFQGQPPAADLRVRDARIVDRGLSSGLRPRRISVRHRTHHLELRLRCTASRRTAKWKSFYRGLGRPQGMAFDAQGNLYVAASFRGRRGVVRITPDNARPNCFSPVPASSGLAFAPAKAVILATSNSLFQRQPASTGRSP